jgi:CRT10
MESNHGTEPGSVDHHVHSSSDEQSQPEDGDPDEVGSGDEIVTDELIRLDNQLVGDEDQLPNWPDFSMPGGYDSSDVYEFQNGPGGTKKVKLHHSGTLPAFPQPIPGSHGPIIPTLHLSASHLRLFNANCPREASLYCSDLLSFQWPIYYATHPGIDRLNLTQYIPQLGIVVIGTQVGRVAVCSLTRRGLNGPFGLRVDWILPLESQEKKRERPLTHLLGIAVGPVQGHELSRSSSISDDDDELEETWMQDRIDKDGVSITFDPQIIKLGQNTTSNISGAPKHHVPYRPSQTKTRDSRVFSGTKPTRKRTPPVIVKQAWPSRSEVAEASAVDEERWRGLEYSRRCRLMLTYFDQTIMTYELSRCAPFVGDPAMGRPNWRNRDEFW